MIKFFRHIRRQRIKDPPERTSSVRAGNSVSKYLLYAIGEILLVVVGILIALQLNNWNGERKADIQEMNLLKEMRQNLERDLSDCRFNIGLNEQLYNGNAAVLRHLEQRSPFHDSLRVHYGSLWGNTVQSMNTSAYDNLNSIGFDLIRNDSLRRSITVLYSERYAYIKRLEIEFDTKIQLNEMLPQTNAKIITDTLWKSGYPVNAVSLMDDIAFKGLLRTNVFVRTLILGQYRLLEQQHLNLIEQIDNELESRQQ